MGDLMAKQAFLDVELIKQYNNNIKWFFDHCDLLQSKYENKYIAINNNKIVAFGKSFSEIRKELNKKKVSIIPVLIKYMPKDETMPII